MKTSMCAFLRGVNLNGKNMKMADVCQVFQRAPVHNVRSVLATGNILFESDSTPTELRPLLEKMMSEGFATEIFLFIKTQEEIESICLHSPFPPQNDLHVYAFLCEQGLEAVLMKQFETIKPIAQEKAQISHRQFYWQVPKGSTLDAGFSKGTGDRKLRNCFTSRNLNTVQKVYQNMLTFEKKATAQELGRMVQKQVASE